LRQELFGEGFFGMVMEEGESGHGEDCVAQRFSYGDLFNDKSDRFLDVFVSA
jgi:archaellum biogenesis ATPase FlaH